ncbi:MAG: hypothetical protein H6656_05850 [Ardenticatenaceae bacterium]|nr:hypothetical protein [Ardenticatenaceae bacterium]
MSTYQQHHLVLSRVKYPGGLRLVECQECQYAFAVEFDAHGVIKMETKESINKGDQTATHSLFQTPAIELEVNFGADLEVDEEQYHFGDI